jgi:YgiT-type zinc finger domain-containing protein
MLTIKCLFCGKPTTIHKINAQKKINGKVVTVTNAPVYYCAPCEETFLAKETQDVFTYVKDRGLENKSIIFNYDDMQKKIY